MSDLWGKGNSAAALDRQECFAHKRSIAAMRQRSKASCCLSENRTLGRSFPHQGMTPRAGRRRKGPDRAFEGTHPRKLGRARLLGTPMSPGQATDHSSGADLETNGLGLGQCLFRWPAGGVPRGAADPIFDPSWGGHRRSQANTRAVCPPDLSSGWPLTHAGEQLFSDL